jgi:hypothetical protein
MASAVSPLQSLQCSDLFAERLASDPKFASIVDMHALFHENVLAGCPLMVARTSLSNEQGVFTKTSQDKSSTLRVQVLGKE